MSGLGPATVPPAQSSPGRNVHLDERDDACGRGWAALGTAGRLVGHFFIHDSEFEHCL